MKNILIALALLSSASARADVKAAYVAHHTNFIVSSIAGLGEDVYFNCDSVEQEAASLLAKLGAINVSVRCSGGIESGMPATDAFVTANFSALAAAGADARNTVDASYKQLELNGWDNCYLETELFKGFQGAFAISASHVSNCFHSNDRFEINATILK